MTEEFREEAKKLVTEWKAAGKDPVDALRDLERHCAKNGTPASEFSDPHVERKGGRVYRQITQGQKLVEEVYGGKFYFKLGGIGVGYEEE